MVLPGPGNPEIGSRQSFASKSGFFKHADGTRIIGNTGGFDPVQPQRTECENQHQLQRLAHEAATGEPLAYPVADLPALRHAMPDIADGDSADELAGGVFEYEE